MHGESEVSHAKITVHRRNQASRSSARDETYVTQLSRNGTRSSTRHTRAPSQKTTATTRLGSISSARNSMSSLHSSRQGTPYTRQAPRKKRAIDFSQVSHPRKQSADVRHVRNHSRQRRSDSVAGDSISYPKPGRGEGRNRGSTIMDRPRPRLKIVEPKDPRIIVEEEVRSFSDSIAKDCDDAFTSSVIEADISELPNLDELPNGKRSSTPYSLSIGTPSITSPTVQSNNHRWDARPLPPLPPDVPSPATAVLEESRSASQQSNRDEQLVRKSKFLGLLAKPVLLPKHDRRVVSAPPYTQDGHACGNLPVISENARELDPAHHAAGKSRIVSAPPPRTPREQADAEGLDYLARVGDTIRVVNSPSATSPIPAPLNVRKKMTGRPGISVNTEITQAYMHGALNESTAQTFAAEPEVVKKKKSWFRRGAKQEGSRPQSGHTVTTQWTTPTEGTRPSTTATDSTAPPRSDDASLQESGLPPPMAAKRKAFGFLFWKNSKKNGARMSIAGKLFDWPLFASMSSQDITGPDHEDSSSPEFQHSAHRANGRGDQRSFTESDSDVRKIEVHQTWIARLFGVKPATSYMCLAVSRRVARQEITILLKEWRQYGIRDLQVDKERNMVFARLSAKNCKSANEVMGFRNTLLMRCLQTSTSRRWLLLSRS